MGRKRINRVRRSTIINMAGVSSRRYDTKKGMGAAISEAAAAALNAAFRLNANRCYCARRFALNRVGLGQTADLLLAFAIQIAGRCDEGIRGGRQRRGCARDTRFYQESVKLARTSPIACYVYISNGRRARARARAYRRLIKRTYTCAQFRSTEFQYPADVSGGCNNSYTAGCA